MNEELNNIIKATLDKFDPSKMTEEQYIKHYRRVETYKLKEENKKTQELRLTWNAPKRHCIMDELDRSGEWGQVADKLEEKLASGSGILVALVGKRGAGKTQLAVELMKANTTRMKSALYVSTTEWFMAIKATYRKGSDQTEIDVIKQYRKPNLLVLDEYGRRGDTEWENNLLFELLDKRYADMHSTILISNQSSADLIESLGRSLSSRLMETGGIVECEWQSWRNPQH